MPEERFEICVVCIIPLKRMTEPQEEPWLSHLSDSEINVDPSEVISHSFIIKIWREETSVGVDHAIWRGHITHVPGGERRYLKSLDDIPFFILPYLQQMQVQLTLGWRIRQWLSQRKWS